LGGWSCKRMVGSNYNITDFKGLREVGNEEEREGERKRKWDSRRRKEGRAG